MDVGFLVIVVIFCSQPEPSGQILYRGFQVDVRRNAASVKLRATAAVKCFDHELQCMRVQGRFISVADPAGTPSRRKRPESKVFVGTIFLVKITWVLWTRPAGVTGLSRERSIRLQTSSNKSMRDKAWVIIYFAIKLTTSFKGLGQILVKL